MENMENMENMGNFFFLISKNCICIESGWLPLQNRVLCYSWGCAPLGNSCIHECRIFENGRILYGGNTENGRNMGDFLCPTLQSRDNSF